MSTVAHFFIIIVAQKFVITWLTFSLTFTFVGVARGRPAKYLYDVSSNLNRKPHIC